MKKLVAIVGPTASGKTALSIALAKEFAGEIISADSRQLYREFNIGTDKISGIHETYHGHDIILHDGIAHYMIDVLNPTDSFSVGAYMRRAFKIIDHIHEIRKQPFLVGGTMFYTQAVMDNYALAPSVDNQMIRKALEQRLQVNGLNSLLGELADKDPKILSIIDKKNPRRITRALEVIVATGKPFSSFQKRGKPRYSVLRIAPVPGEKTMFKKRIESRVDEHVRMGLFKEAEFLFEKYGADVPAFDSIGYKQLVPYFRGVTSLASAIDEIKKATWRYAKRQMTWYGKDSRIHWVSTDNEAKELVGDFLRN